ncbi:MAG: Bax inhibitor-1/YccA family protein [Bacteroidales bacterium]|nr:Bax inhibitor-1/YccA family protein [Bacteroidales bacterium]
MDGSVPHSAQSGTSVFSGVMTRVYTWMAAALMLTAATAWFTASSPAMLQLIYGNQAMIWVLMIAELGLVMGISWGIQRLSPTHATLLFLLYSVVNGLTLSSIFFAYSIGTIYQAFAAAALTFGAMSIMGYTIKKDLSGLGGIMLMALIGLIIASVVNIFWSNTVLDSIITYVGVFLFVGLTAYDTQRIKAMCTAAEQYGDAAAPRRVAILGALSLYLDFINLFLYLLRLFGRSRD